MTQLKVSGEVILGYLLFSRLSALSMAPKRTPVGTRLLAPFDKVLRVRTRFLATFDKVCGVGTRVLTPFHKVCRASEQAQVPAVHVNSPSIKGSGKGYLSRYGL